jgi:hypothetical protein
MSKLRRVPLHVLERRRDRIAGLIGIFVGLGLFLASVATLAARWDAVLTFGVR